MLSKEVCESTYQEIEDGGYLDDWVLNCARAVRDQAKSAVDLQSQVDFLKDYNEKCQREISRLESIIDEADEANAKLQAKLNEIEKLCMEYQRIATAYDSTEIADGVLQILKGGKT